MPSSFLAEEVRRQIARFVSGEIDPWDLDDWLNARTLNVAHDDPAFPPSREVFLLFAEVTSGHRNEDEVRDRLRASNDDEGDGSQVTPVVRLGG